MRRIKRAFVISTSILFMNGCAGTSPKVEQLSASAQLFQRNCAVCHAKDGSGGQLEGQEVPNLKAEHARSLTDEQLTAQIFNGGKRMPAFKYTLTDEQIEQLVRFIRQELQDAKR